MNEKSLSTNASLDKARESWVLEEKQRPLLEELYIPFILRVF